MKKLLFLTFPFLMLSACSGPVNDHSEYDKLEEYGQTLAKESLDYHLEDILKAKIQQDNLDYRNVVLDGALLYKPVKSKTYELHMKLVIYIGKTMQTGTVDMYGRFTEEDEEEMKMDRWNGTYSNEEMFNDYTTQIKENVVTRGIILDHTPLDTYLSELKADFTL